MQTINFDFVRQHARSFETEVYDQENEAISYQMHRVLSQLRAVELALMALTKQEPHMKFDLLTVLSQQLNMLTNMIHDEPDVYTREQLKKMFCRIAQEYQRAAESFQYR